jgi:hypoxanthine phosphoribosyltransferase
VPPETLLDAETLAATVTRLGSEIEADHPEGVVLVVVLKGALLFGSDLARAIRRVPVEIDFISISRFAPDSGRVKILHDLDTDIGGRDVVLVEDIVDTGLTVAYLTSQLAMREPLSLRTCALLDRPGRRIVPHALQYRGVELDDQFVLGYGLHVRDLYRNLPFVVAGTRDEVVASPDCYVRDLYRGGGSAAEGGGSVTDGTDARSEVL